MPKCFVQNAERALYLLTLSNKCAIIKAQQRKER